MTSGPTLFDGMREALDIFNNLDEDARIVAQQVDRLVNEFGYEELQTLQRSLNNFLMDLVSPHGYIHELEKDLEDEPLDGEPEEPVPAPAASQRARSAPMRGGRM